MNLGRYVLVHFDETFVKYRASSFVKGNGNREFPRNKPTEAVSHLKSDWFYNAFALFIKLVKPIKVLTDHITASNQIACMKLAPKQISD